MQDGSRKDSCSFPHLVDLVEKAENKKDAFKEEVGPRNSERSSV